ncbi:MAG: type IV pilus secretin PilQ, partial [Zoogloea sp.]|nr:type IV pilus secretin PilQ [Zoogloea sp.]
EMSETNSSSRLEDVRKLVTQIDVPVRQVLIEARIVDASDTFTRNIGAKLGFGGAVNNRTVNVGGNTVPQYTFGSGLGYTSVTSGVASGTASLSDTLAVNLPASQIVNRTPGALSMVLWNNAATRFLELELSALEADGRGKVVSRPRVMTADQVEALIEQGVEIPYQTASSAANAPSVQFKKANLALKVRPQITPDGRVSLSLEVNKDTPNATYSTQNGIAIDTKHVKTEVLIENGGTVVIGGIFEQTTRNAENKIPLLGDVPILGYLFKSQERTDNRTELLVFITPRIVDERLQLQ